jgi:hypothetical protein
VSRKIKPVATTTTSIHRVAETGTGARTLDRLIEHADLLEGVWTGDVATGDWVMVRTRNSTYSLAPLGEGRYHVTGGWFASRPACEQDVRIVGCTWGGAAIHTRLVAAVGMFLEFDNGVRTTRIQDVRLIKLNGGRNDRTH